MRATSLKAISTAYEAGEGDFLRVLDAERLLLTFQLEHARARVNRLVALKRLEAIDPTHTPLAIQITITLVSLQQLLAVGIPEWRHLLNRR